MASVFYNFSVKLKQLIVVPLSLVAIILSNDKAQAQATSCSCDVLIPTSGSGSVEIPAGQTWCLKSGSYSTNPIKIAAGGKLCVSAGATLTVGGWISGDLNGTIVNSGTIVMPWMGTYLKATVQNYGTITIAGMDGYSGVLENYGTFSMEAWGSFYEFKYSGSNNITNKGVFKASNVVYSSSGNFQNDSTITLTGNYTMSSGSGSLNNKGSMTMKIFTYEGNGNVTNSGKITVDGKFTMTKGALTNSGRLTHTAGNEFVYNNSTGSITNTGKLYINNVKFTGTSFSTSDSLVINNGLTFNTGGILTNTGIARINMSTTASDMSFYGNLDNSGLMEFAKISNLSSSVNNYGLLKVYNEVNNISESTYLTNDSTLNFINVSDVQFNGPMLTNNGRLTVSHGSNGNFKMNKAINQVYNNGIIVTTGDIELNNAGAKLVNNCRLVCRTFFIRNGTTENNGLIWATTNVENNGATSYLKNAATGQVRGTNFVNSGYVSGYGSFYFTGNTNNTNSIGAASFAGGSSSSTILFYDASSTSGDVFDAGNLYTNTTRPSSLTPSDTTTYSCTAPPSVAGYPPTTKAYVKSVCDISGSINIPLYDSIAPHAPVGGSSFTVLYSTIKLFEYGNSSNATNNTTSLTIAGKGTFVANTTTGNIVFTPVSGFSGSAVAEYRISNSRPGDSIIYPSGRKKITVTMGSGGISNPTVSVTGS